MNVENHKGREPASPELEAAWESYEAYRRERKFKTLTATSVRVLFKRFKEWGDALSILGIEKSIANGWQGIFKPEESELPKKSDDDGWVAAEPTDYQGAISKIKAEMEEAGLW